MSVAAAAMVVGDPTVGYGISTLGQTSGCGYTFADCPVGQRITTTQDWQTRINTIGAGSAGSPKLIGVEAGTHSGTNVQNVQPLAYQYFIGETDGTPITVYPNGTPTTVIDGGQTVTSPGTTYFMRPGGTNVVLENLEVTGFNAAGYENNLMTINDNTGDDWLIFNCYIHHNYDGVKASTNMRLEHCVLDNMSRHWLLSSGYPGHPSPQNEGGWRVQNCQISNNNNQNSDWQVTGTMKVGGGQTNKVYIVANDITDNWGPAIWFDASSEMEGSDTEHDLAEITNNRMVDNGVGFFWEIMGNDSYSNRVGVLFDRNHVEITGRLFASEPVDYNNPHRLVRIVLSRGSATYPIRVTRNVLKHAGPTWTNSPMVHVYQDTSRPEDCKVDYVTIDGNDFEFSGYADAADPSFIAATYTDWIATCPGGEIWDANWSIDNNTYRWIPSDASSYPFVWDGNTQMVWSTWGTYGFDSNGTYTET